MEGNSVFPSSGSSRSNDRKCILAFGSDVEITGAMIAGMVMILEGIGIYILGMQEDFMYDSDLFNWENDEEFFNVIGTFGGLWAIFILSWINSNFQ